MNHNSKKYFDAQLNQEDFYSNEDNENFVDNKSENSDLYDIFEGSEPLSGDKIVKKSDPLASHESSDCKKNNNLANKEKKSEDYKMFKSFNSFGDYDKERALNERKLETFGEFALKSMVRIFM